MFSLFISKTGLEKSPSNELTEDQLELVAAKIGDSWQTLASELGLSDEDVTAIMSETSDLKEHARVMLKQWKEREGGESTRESLIAGLNESGLVDIIESVFEPKSAKSAPTKDEEKEKPAPTTPMETESS